MAAKEEGESGRPVLKNAGPVLMSPGGTLNFNVPMTPDTKLHESFFPCNTPATPIRETPPSSVRSKKGDRMKLSRAPVRRELFGGAITIMLPETFEDVSVLREIPDHQEVFVDRDSEVSLIVELLEHDGTISDEHAPTYYFKDLASCNEVRTWHIIAFLNTHLVIARNSLMHIFISYSPLPSMPIIPGGKCEYIGFWLCCEQCEFHAIVKIGSETLCQMRSCGKTTCCQISKTCVAWYRHKCC